MSPLRFTGNNHKSEMKFPYILKKSENKDGELKTSQNLQTIYFFYCIIFLFTVMLEKKISTGKNVTTFTAALAVLFSIRCFLKAQALRLKLCLFLCWCIISVNAGNSSHLLLNCRSGLYHIFCASLFDQAYQNIPKSLLIPHCILKILSDDEL